MAKDKGTITFSKKQGKIVFTPKPKKKIEITKPASAPYSSRNKLS